MKMKVKKFSYSGKYSVVFWIKNRMGGISMKNRGYDVLKSWNFALNYKIRNSSIIGKTENNFWTIVKTVDTGSFIFNRYFWSFRYCFQIKVFVQRWINLISSANSPINYFHSLNAPNLSEKHHNFLIHVSISFLLLIWLKNEKF